MTAAATRDEGAPFAVVREFPGLRFAARPE